MKRERRTYPTGLVCDVWTLENENRTLRLEIDRLVKPAPGWERGAAIGKVELTGILVPKGATGIIRHESLPVRSFGTGPAALSAAKKTARQWFRKLAPIAA
jgi:hypothetical protein